MKKLAIILILLLILTRSIGTIVRYIEPFQQVIHDVILEYMVGEQMSTNKYRDVCDVEILRIDEPFEIEYPWMTTKYYPVKTNLKARNGSFLGEADFLVHQDQHGDWCATPTM